MAEREKIKMVYAGLEMLSGGKPGVRFYPIKSDGTIGADTDGWVYEQKGKGKKITGNPGQIFEFERDADAPPSRVYWPGQWVGTWGNAQDRTRWLLETTALEADLARRKEEAAGKTDDALKALLAPLRERYRAAIGTTKKAAILARVIASITS